MRVPSPRTPKMTQVLPNTRSLLMRSRPTGHLHMPPLIPEVPTLVARLPGTPWEFPLFKEIIH
ncbi:hypothetical protein BDD12DRAFT_837335 [Trichophaea hybrida]|nr:hypothetical protein BDD12DRAFT_837335 [Trichophaea hybrida]